MSAVARAVASGSVGHSMAQPESGVRALVERVQANLPKPIEDLTESERIRELADLETLGELIAELGAQGCL